MVKCLKCGKDASNQHDKYFVVPGFIMVPNCYRTCEEHKDIMIKFEDVYHSDGTRKKFEDSSNGS